MSKTDVDNPTTGDDLKEVMLGPKSVMIPSKWEVSSIKDLTVNEKFAIVDGPFGTQLHADEYVEEGYPLVRISNLSFSGEFIDDDLVFLSEEKISELDRSKIVPGDIIVAKTGATIGKNAIFPDNYEKGLIASSCLKVSINESESSKKFVHYWINSEFGQDLIDLYSSGSTRSSINIEPFGRIKIPKPSLPEQHRIANILSKVDVQIQQTDEIIERTKELKSGLVQDLLTRGIGHEEFKEVRVGTKKVQIPAAWEHLTVKDLIEDGIIEKIKDGNHGNLHPKSEDFVSEGVPFLTSDVVQDHRIYWEDSKKITQNTADNLRKGKARAGDLILTHKGSVGRVNIIPDSKDLVVLSPQVTYYRTSEQISTEFLAHQFKSYIFQNQLRVRSKQSTRDYIGLTKQKNLEVFLPTLDEQEEIAEKLSVIDEKFREEEDYKKKLKELKNGLMQDLLTGKVRVNTQ